MQAVLMVAGKSTRTYPLTLTRPKPLLPMLNRPLIYHSLDQLAGLFDQVILITGYCKEMIEADLGKEYRGMKIIYQEQRQQLGTGHAVLQAKPHIQGKFVAMNGDDLFAHTDIKRLVQYEYAALAKRAPNPELYGVYQVDEQFNALNLVEKPKTYLGDLVNIGCYVLQPDFFDELEKTPLSERGEIEITSAILNVARRRPYKVVPIEEFWLPTGYAWDLLQHQEFLVRNHHFEKKSEIEKGVVVKGDVSIGENTIIKNGVYVEGPVVIGSNCVIGPNSYIRPCTSIGDNSTIGAAVEIKNSIIFPHCLIQHQSYIGDSIIGEACLIGAGTITANHRHDSGAIQSMIKGRLVDTKREKLGAILGDHVKTGIHTSFYPGRKCWPKTITRPGQIVQSDLIPEGSTWE